MKQHLLYILHKISKILIIVIGLVILAVIVYYVYNHFNNKTSDTSTTSNINDTSKIEVYDNNIVGEISKIDSNTKTLTVNNFSTKEDKFFIVNNESGVFKLDNSILDSTKLDPNQINSSESKSIVETGKYVKTDFSSLKVGQVVKALTNQISANQTDVVAWEVYIIN